MEPRDDRVDTPELRERAIRLVEEHAAEHPRASAVQGAPRRPPSTYVLHKTPARGSPAAKRRAHRDDALGVEMQRVWDTNHPVYGPRKGWKPRPRDGARVAGCTVRRLMRAMGLAAAGGPG